MYSILSKRLAKDTLLRSTRPCTLLANSNRMFASKLDEKEKGDERIFFNKQDGIYFYICQYFPDNHPYSIIIEQLLRNLMTKASK